MWRGAAIAVTALGAFSAAALTFGAPVPVVEALVLYPRHVPVAPWRAHPELHPFVVRAGDGTVMRGWIVDGTQPHAPWTLMFTGNAGTAESMRGIEMWFARRTGSTTVLWDYLRLRLFGRPSGHRENPGRRVARVRCDATCAARVRSSCTVTGSGPRSRRASRARGPFAP